MTIQEKVNNLDEGWAIYDSLSDNGWEWRIERHDDEAKFKDDGEAVRYVFTQALLGSNVHREAFKFMSENGNAKELGFIVRAILNINYR